jgi:hypothetical protein
MKKQLAAVALTGTMLGGGLLGATLFTPGLAGAQDEAPAAADVERPDAGVRVGVILAPLITDGTLTQFQADAVTEAFVTAGEQRQADRQERQADRQADREEQHAALAAELGISVDDLTEALQSGQTLAEVAEANGSSAEAVIAFMEGELADHLAESVANGDIDQERADEIAASASERIAERVNNGGGHEGRRGGGPGGRPGAGGPNAAFETEGA